ncbi:MAG TPA: ribosomal-processing cysteine protease Prp [Clostridiales bacterium]|nr:ribosomal-processing cysteine protease Prp [Clostridiales bacterium]
MIKISIYSNAQDLITGFKVIGHADYDEYGKDIVCSAVSVLIINTINSIDKFTSDKFSLKQDEKKGLFDFKLSSIDISSNTSLLLDSLILGLTHIEKEYTNKYLKIQYKRATK